MRHFLWTKWHCGRCPPNTSGFHAYSHCAYCSTLVRDPELVPVVAGVSRGLTLPSNCKRQLRVTQNLFQDIWKPVGYFKHYRMLK
jgi:hypothetical protein